MEDAEYYKQQLKVLREETDGDDAFRAYMRDTLDDWAHEVGIHTGSTPPMMWPELIQHIFQARHKELLEELAQLRKENETLKAPKPQEKPPWDELGWTPA